MEVHQSSNTGLESHNTLFDEVARMGLYWCRDNIFNIMEWLEQIIVKDEQVGPTSWLHFTVTASTDTLASD